MLDELLEIQEGDLEVPGFGEDGMEEMKVLISTT